MSVEWACESDDGKITRISIGSEIRALSCSIGDKPHDAANCIFNVSSLNFIPDLGEVVPSYYLELANISSSEPNPNPIEISATIGVTSVTELDRLLDICLTKMIIGEVSAFEIKCSNANVKANIVLKLINFENSREVHEMTPEELMGLASQLKEHGVKLYSDHRIPDSFNKFSKSVKYLVLIEERNETDTTIAAKQKLMTALLGNLAGCHVASENWEAAIDLCNSVLGNDPQNVKALFRRGVALIEIQEFERARLDLLAVKKLEPGNSTIKIKLALLNEKEKAWKLKYASVMKKMFGP